mmetsp:Transcript_31830/g.85021  ORF Transcript_31830/g.85021 Transcript_31830/m.85021 type:complete len:209 (+) Transcript_31830:662-1288(+)
MRLVDVMELGVKYLLCAESKRSSARQTCFLHTLARRAPATFSMLQEHKKDQDWYSHGEVQSYLLIVESCGWKLVVYCRFRPERQDSECTKRTHQYSHGFPSVHNLVQEKVGENRHHAKAKTSHRTAHQFWDHRIRDDVARCSQNVHNDSQDPQRMALAMLRISHRTQQRSFALHGDARRGEKSVGHRKREAQHPIMHKHRRDHVLPRT